MQQNFIENELVILTKQTLDIFLKQENPAELISLYTFYYYTAKWQQTNQVKCTTDYVAKGLHWNRNKVIKIKKQLIEFGLIEDARIVDENTKRVTGYYIKMNYIFKKKSLEKNQCTQNPPTGFEVLGSSVLENEGVESEYTNALSANNINALSACSKKESKNAECSNEPKNSRKTFNEIIDDYTENEELRKVLREHLKTRKLKRSSLTNQAIILGLKKLDTLANTDEEKILIVQNSIVNGWTEFFALKKSENRSKKSKQAPQSYSIEDFASYNIFESMEE